MRVARWSDAGVAQAAERAFAEVIDALYRLHGSTDPTTGDMVPECVGLESGAKALFIEFFNEHADELAGMEGRDAALWSKLRGYAARLALIVHCARHAACDPKVEPNQIDVVSIVAGIIMARWFGTEALRVYRAHTETLEEREARELREFIISRNGRVTARDLQRGMRRYADNAEAAEFALTALVDRGEGCWDHSSKGKPGRPTSTFCLAASPDFDPTIRPSADGTHENQWDSGIVSSGSTTGRIAG